jgi:hypothetical protein
VQHCRCWPTRVSYLEWLLTAVKESLTDDRTDDRRLTCMRPMLAILTLA